MSTHRLPHVAVVLINFNGLADTLACLTSLQALDYPDFRVFVVDNHSSGDDVAQLWAAHPEITVIASPTNRGFAGGCNLGMEEALQDSRTAYVWLLNNDTTVAPDALTAMVTQAQATPYALVGSTIYHPDGRFQRVGNRLAGWQGRPRDYTLADIKANPRVDSLSGCSMLLPREVIEVVGYWDEGYFLYFEDNDYCWRARQAGFSCVVSRDSRVFHQEGATTGRNRPLVTYYYQRNRLRLLRRYFSPLAFWAVRGYTRLRQFRSTIKAGLSASPEKRQHHRAFALAVQDFESGIDGPCPHTI